MLFQTSTGSILFIWVAVVRAAVYWAGQCRTDGSGENPTEMLVTTATT
jgi:hypothetical protein